MVLTTLYSGQGAGEFSVAEAHRVACHALGAQAPAVDIHSACCEFSSKAQKVLHAHGPATRPMHIFTDNMDRIDDQNKQNLISAQYGVSEQLRKKEVELYAAMVEKEAKVAFSDFLRRMELKLVRSCRNILMRARIMEKVYCTKCQGDCCLKPKKRSPTDLD